MHALRSANYLSLQNLRSLRIGVRLTLCFAVLAGIMLLGAIPAIWQLRIYNDQVKRLSSIDRRMISVLKVNNQVLTYRELMESAALGNDQAKLRKVLMPFRASFAHDVLEATDALAEFKTEGTSLSRTMYTLLSFETAIPGEIDATLEMAGLEDWQATHYRLNNQMLKTHRVLSQVVSEIETEANAERKATLQNMKGMQYRLLGWLPFCFSLVLLASTSVLGARVTHSIAEPLVHLEAGAEALGAGNFSHRVTVSGKDELATVSLAFNTAAAKIEQLHQGLESLVAERTASLRVSNEALQKLSSQDPLTGLANRRVLDEKLQLELSRSRVSSSPLSLLMVDVDHFKGLNDAYGHQTGDNCLIHVVRSLQSVPLRADDLIARYGGEEFAVILSETDADGARAVAERMRLAVLEQKIPNRSSPLLQRVSVSIGVATILPDENITGSVLIEESDRALYRAKQRGRNLVCAA